MSTLLRELREDEKQKLSVAIAALEEKLPELAELARIPEPKRALFNEKIIRSVFDDWRLALFQPNKAVMRAAQALQVAVDAIDALDDEDRARVTLRYKNGPEDAKDFLERYRDLPWSEKQKEAFLVRSLEKAKIMTQRHGGYEFVGWHALLHDMKMTFADANKLRGVRLPDEPPRRRGQRSEARKNYRFKWLVIGLRKEATECGGKLTFDRKNGGRGTLIAALKLIAPYLPAGLVPNRLPCSSIDRWIRDYSRKR